MAEAKGAKQLVICQTSREVNLLSNWDIREVLKILKIKVEEEEAMRETWVHDQTKMPMEDIMKKPNLVKSAATKPLKVFLTAGNLKLGKDSFPGWRFCVEKAYFMNTSTSLFQNVNGSSKYNDILAQQGTWHYRLNAKKIRINEQK